MALLADSRRVAVWGVNQNGLLGLGSKANMNVRTPTLIPGVFCDQVIVEVTRWLRRFRRAQDLHQDLNLVRPKPERTADIWVPTEPHKPLCMATSPFSGQVHMWCFLLHVIDLHAAPNSLIRHAQTSGAACCMCHADGNTMQRSAGAASF